MLMNERAPQTLAHRRLVKSLKDQQDYQIKRRFTMAGQPTVFDLATTIPYEGGVALAPPYAIINQPNTLSLQAYFHCGGRDRVERARIATALSAATTTVTFFLHDLQALGSTAFGPVAAALPPLASGVVQAEFQGAGDLVGSGLDPTDDYYRTAILGPIPLPVVAAGSSQTIRILTVLRAGSNITAFDDSLVIQIIA
jgi:hypothetical protein